jgi:2'-5' RNA ligase
VIWVGVEPSPALRCLKQDLEWGLAGHGFERETRAFHPHITIGRIEGDEGAGAFRGMDGLAAGLSHRGKVAVKSVDLMRSQLLKQGPIYTLLRESPLRSSSRRR